MKIWFDMDGTIADLYGVDNWLDDLQNERTRPYKEAKALFRLSTLSRLLHKAQEQGHEIGIISWTSKNGCDEYNFEVSTVKMWWLKKHMKSVQWDTVLIVKYGTNKYSVCKEGILFDDEERNRMEWGGKSYAPDQIFEVLKQLTK